ncbi:MAG: ABC-type transport auxiliary lipoprotein family protein [Rubrivivax sp.]
MKHPHRSLPRRDCLRQGLAALPLLAGAPWLSLLAGCTLGEAPRRDFHVLRDPLADAAPAPAARIDQVLLLAAAPVPGLYDSDRMVFSADGRSRSYFQFGYWSARPAQSLLLLAETRLARTQRFREVASSTSGVRGDLLLTLRLDELYLDASLEPGLVRLSLGAELIEWRSRRLLARRSFAKSAPAVTRDAAGVAQAASEAIGEILGEWVIWVGASALAA